MRLFLDCSGTLVFRMFTTSPLPNMPVCSAAKRFVSDYPECEVVVWSSGSENDAASTAHLCLDPYEVDGWVAMKKDDLELPQDGDYVVDDDSSIFGHRETYPFLNDFHFFLPEEFERYGL